MNDWKWLSVLIGVLGALLGVYFREGYRRALQQRRIAAQLSAYIMSWQMAMQKMGMGGIMALVRTWHEERTDALATGGRDLFIRMHKKHDQKLSDLKAKLNAYAPEVRELLEANHRQLRAMSASSFDFAMKELHDAREALFSTKTFVSDADAAELGAAAAYRAVEFKTELRSLLSHMQRFDLALRDSEHLDLVTQSQPVANIL